MQKCKLLSLCVAVIGVNGNTKISHHSAKHPSGGEAGGEKQIEESHSAHKHQAKLGKKAHHDHEVASKGKSELTHHKTITEEGAGKKSKSHSQGGHQASKSAGGHSEHGAKFEEGGKHKKNGFEKGFREQYHKNEFKKQDSFFSNGHKSGDYHIYGAKAGKNHAQKFNKESKAKHSSAKSSGKHLKSGKKAGGHKAVEDKGHKHETATKSSYGKHDKWAKKGQQNKHNIHKYKYYPTKN